MFSIADDSLSDVSINDVLKGGRDNDRLYGGTGSDLLNGGWTSGFLISRLKLRASCAGRKSILA